jgi:di/tricarboxylate transporter
LKYAFAVILRYEPAMQFQEVAALVIFCAVIALVVLLVLVPVSLQLPPWKTGARRWKLRLHYSGVPVVGVLAMLATGSLNGRTLAAGIVGDATLKPYGILILFMALAYISTSLDMTGCFGWLVRQLACRQNS